MGNLRIKVIRFVGVWLALLLSIVLGFFTCNKATNLLITSVDKSITQDDQNRIAYKEFDESQTGELTLEDWKKARPDLLLPGADDSSPAVGGELFFSGGGVPSQDAQEIVKVSEGFLRQWDTFSPGDTSLQSRVSPFVLDESEDVVESRVEAGDPGGVCLSSKNCWIGLRWPYGARAILALAHSGPDWVVVQGWGTVQYTGEDPETRGRYLERAYGILLQQRGGRWQIVRAVGESRNII